MSSPKKCLKCLMSAMFTLPMRLIKPVGGKLHDVIKTHPTHHHQSKCSVRQSKLNTQFLIRFTIFVILTLSLIALLFYTGITDVFTSNKIHEKSYSEHAKENGNDFDYDGERIKNKHENSWNHPSQNDARRRAPKTSEKQDTFKERKSWMRIGDEVFVYSAYLDTRNFTTYPTQSNGNLSTSTDKGAARRVEEIAAEEQATGEYSDDDDDDKGGGGDDSDKLNDVLLIRVIGIKAVPPLRDFIKKDILDWFRMKHEMEFSQKYECRLFFNSANDDDDDGKLMFIPSSRVTYTIIEEGVKVYAGAYFNCYFDLRTHSAKISRMIRSYADNGNLQVALYPKNVEDYPTKLINVDASMKSTNEDVNYNPKTLAVCVRPLFGPFDDVLKLIQFISYYHVMGITQFNFYSMSISLNVRKFLSNLSEATSRTENLKEDDNDINGKGRLPRFIVNDWNLPTGNTSELWDYGTLAALNDCLFSNMDQEFVLFVDIDEFIVPQEGLLKSKMDKVDTSSKAPNVTLWNIIDSHDKKTTYQYLIRNTFFCNEFCELGQNMNNQGALGGKSEVGLFPPASLQAPRKKLGNRKTIKESRQLQIFRCVMRTKRVWSAALRSKFIVNPRQVLSVGHHLVTKYVNRKVDFRFTPGHSVQVDPNLAIMNHYRECTSISSKKHPVLTRTREVDGRMLKFKNKIMDFIRLYDWS